MPLSLGRFLSIALISAVAFAADDQPDLAELVKTGEAAYVKADYDAARAAYEQAWELAQQTGRDNPIRYDVLKRLTAVRAAAGQFADADNYLQLAINWRETINGPNDPKIIDDLLISVALCRGMHNYERAMAILGRVRDMHTRTAGAESIPVASDLSRIAQVYLDQKQPHDAAGALESAVAIRQKLSGSYDPSLLPDLDRLGEVLISVRNYEQAEQTYRRALVIRESLVGKDSPDLITTVDGLAYACFGEKKFDDADPLYSRLIALWTASGGAQHPMLAIAYDKQAIFYTQQQKFEQAKASAEHSNAIRAHFLAMGLAEEATEQLAEGNRDATKAFYRRALAVLDPPDPVYDDFRAQLEGLLKALEPTQPKPKSRKRTQP